MPLYEYQCASCQKVHEVVQKFADAPLTTCPECSGPVTKLMSLGSFSLKGTGWYTTDYKRKGQSTPSPKTETASAPAASTPAAPAAAAPVPAAKS